VKVVVIGAGVIGTAAAWYLSEQGHQVTVLERRDGPGLETSFANGGQISPCHAEPWANPGVLSKLLAWAGREDAPLLLRRRALDADLIAWGLAFLWHCTPWRTRINTERALRLALYSRACLIDLRAATGLSYDDRQAGILHVYRDPKGFAHARAAAELMGRHGLDRRVVDRDGCVALEPALAHAAPSLAGGIFTPGDESGDAHRFTRDLARRAEGRGVAFVWSCTVRRLIAEGRRIRALDTDRGEIAADAVVLAAGCHSRALARPLGLDLPIIPAKGYSITAAVADPGRAPGVSITDDEHKMVYSRLGDRLRCAGTAEFTGFDLTLTPSRVGMIRDRVQALFPGGADYLGAEPWAGLRPVTPDGVPLIGPTPYANLWLDTGHGTLGWTMACGSGRLIADLISGRPPEIAAADLGLARGGGAAARAVSTGG